MALGDQFEQKNSWRAKHQAPPSNLSPTLTAQLYPAAAPMQPQCHPEVPLPWWGLHECSTTSGCRAHPVGRAASSALESWLGLTKPALSFLNHSGKDTNDHKSHIDWVQVSWLYRDLNQDLICQTEDSYDSCGIVTLLASEMSWIPGAQTEK